MKTNLKFDSVQDVLSHIDQRVDDRFTRNAKIITKNLESDNLPIEHQAVRCRCSKSFLYKLHYQKKLKFYKFGNRTYVKTSEVDQLFEEAQTT